MARASKELISAINKRKEFEKKTTQNRNGVTAKTFMDTEPKNTSSSATERTSKSSSGTKRTRASKELINAINKRKEFEARTKSHRKIPTVEKSTVGNSSTVEKSPLRVKRDAKHWEKRFNEEYERIRAEHSNDPGFPAAAHAIAIVEEEKKRDEYIVENQDNTYDDNFWGQFAANFRVGDISERSTEAMADYLKSGDKADYDYSLELDELSKRIQENNKEVYADDATLPWLSQDFAGYVPQFLNQTAPKLVGGGVGGGVAGGITLLATKNPEAALTAAKYGAKAGATAATGYDSYERMKASAFKGLVELGVDEETAKAAANDEAVLSAITEMGDTWFTLSKFGYGAVLNSLGKGTATKTAATGLKKLGIILGKYGLNIEQERAEEGIQGAISVANRRRVLSGNTDNGILGLAKDAGNVLVGVDFGTEDDETINEIKEQKRAGGVIAAVMGVPGTAVDVGANAIITNRNNRIRKLGKDYSVDTEAVIQSGLESDPETEAHQIAQELQRKYEADEVITDEELGRAVIANARAIQTEEQNAPTTLEETAQAVVNDRENGRIAEISEETDEGVKLHSDETETEAKPFNVMSDEAVWELTEETRSLLTNKKCAVGMVDGRAFLSDSNVAIPIANADVDAVKSDMGAKDSDTLAEGIRNVLNNSDAKAISNPVKGEIPGVGTVHLFVTDDGREVAIKKDYAEYFEGYNLEAVFSDNGKPYAVKATDNDGNVAGVVMAVAPMGSNDTYNLQNKRAVGENAVPYAVMSTENPVVHERKEKESNIKKATGYGDYGVKAFADIVMNTSGDKVLLASEFNKAYRYGILNANSNTIDSSSAVQVAAYKAGLQDYNAELDTKKENVKNVVSHGDKAGFDRTNVPSNVSAEAIDIVNRVYKVMGARGRVTGASDLYNARILENKGEVNVASDFIVDESLGEDAASKSFIMHNLHEVLDHYAEELAPEAYMEFKREMYMYKNSLPNEDLADAKRATYAKRKVDISYSEAISEVTANSIFELYDNDIDLLAKGLDRVMNGTNAKAKKGANAFMKALDYIIDKLNKVLEKLVTKVRIKYKPVVDETVRLRNLLEKTLSAAVVQSKKNATQTTAQKNTDLTDGDVKHSVKELIDEQGNSYGIGVYLDSNLLTGLTEKERIEIVKEYVKEIGGSELTAYDNNDNAIKIRIAESSQRYKNKNGSKVPVNRDLTSYLNNKVKQEAIVLIDELMSNANYKNSKAANYSHDWLDDNGKNKWDYWKVFIQEKNKTVWEATLNIANTANGEKILYDIYPIKKAEQSVTSDTSTANNSILASTDSVNTKFSLRDDEYMNAVNNGDMETAQRMVDEAAKEAGYTVKGYHGTDNEFNTFDINRNKSNTGKSFYGNGFYFSTSERDASNYGNIIKTVYLRAKKVLDLDGDTWTYELGLEGQKEVVEVEKTSIEQARNGFINVHYTTKDAPQNWKSFSNVSPMQLTGDETGRKFVERRLNKRSSILPRDIKNLAELAKQKGFDAIKGAGTNIGDLGTEYVVFSKNQIKSADPVTYDNNGNVIPLSERFNESNKDIRYSLKDYSYENLTRKQPMKLTVLSDNAPDNRTDIIYQAKKNAAKVGTVNSKNNTISVFVNDIGKDVVIGTDGLKHSLRRSKGIQTSPNSLATLKAGEIIKNSIRINELTPTKESASGAYVLIGAAKSTAGDLYIVRSVVNEYSNELASIDVLYAINTKKEPAVLNAPRYAEKPLSVTDSKISIARLLDYVNEYFPELLPESILRHYGYDARPVGDFSEDALFSLKGAEKDVSLNEVAKLKETITDMEERHAETVKAIKTEFRDQLKVSKIATADKKALEKTVKAILKEYDSKTDVSEVQNALNDLYIYMANGEDGNVSWDELYNRAYTLASDILKGVSYVDDSLYREEKNMRDYFRNTRIYYDTSLSSDFAGYDNISSFRKANMGRINLTKDGTPVDTLWGEMSSLFPGYFNYEEILHPAEMLTSIADALDSIQPMEYNPYSHNMRQAATYLANDIIERFYDLPQMKTIADKAKAKVVQAKVAGFNKIAQLREEKNAKIQKAIAEGREKAKKAVLGEKMAAAREMQKMRNKYEQRIEKMSESGKVKVLRAKIISHANDLSKKLLSPTDKQHIPHQLQGAVAKLLECINLESNYTYDTESHSYKKNDKGLPTRRTQAFHELKNLYVDMAAELTIDPDLMGDNGLLSDVIGLADLRIADMTSSQLQTVWETMQAIEATITTANRMFSEGKFETISSVADALRAENAGKKKKTELRFVGGMQKLASLDMLTPETYLHMLGEAGDSIFRMMRNAQDKHISIMKEVSDFTQKELKGVNVNKLEKKIHTVKLGGEDVQLTTAQLMELYVLMRRDQAKEHILIGGILPDVINKGLKKITEVEPIRGISAEEIGKALSLLSEDEKVVAEKLQKFVSAVLSKYGNEASMQVYNYAKFNEKNYWTIRTNQQEIKSDIGADTAVTTVANRGFTKGTKPHANTSVCLGSIFDTFSAHASDMATYAAWLGTSEDVNRIRNFVFWEDGARTGTVKGLLDRVHGSQGSKYLEKLLTDIAIGVRGTDDMNPFARLTGAYKAASVGANIRVVIQQPIAILRALDMIGGQYLLIAEALNPMKGWEKAKKYAPIAQWKDWGYFDINTGRQMKDVLFDNASVVEKAKQAGMWGASKADSISWGKLWNAVEAETKAKHKELKVGSEEYYKAVAERFTEIVDHTQVVDGILQRSQIMRSKSELTKMATSFMGEPTKQYNMATASAYDAKNKTGAARKKAVGRLGRTAVALAVSGIVNAMAQSVVDAVRDDDKEKDYWEKWLEAFIGIEGDEETAWDYVKNIADSNLADTFNPLAYIPFAKDVVSIFQGYDVKRMDTEAITKTVNAATNMYKSITGEGKYTIAESSANLFAESARLFGLPVANVKRDVKTLAMTALLESDNYVGQYRMEKASFEMNYAGNKKTFMDILYNAYTNDREAYEIIFDDMIKEDKFKTDKSTTAEVIASNMESRMMKAEGVTKTSELKDRYRTPSQEKTYNSKLKTISDSGAWKSASAEERKDAKNNLHNIVAGNISKELQKTLDEGKPYGLDDTEYVLYKLALDVANTDGNESYTATEKAAALDSISLGNGEIAYLWAQKQALEAYAYGIDMNNYADFKGAVSNIKGEDKKERVQALANKYSGNSKEYLYFMGTVYSSYKKSSDYKKYFD